MGNGDCPLEQLSLLLPPHTFPCCRMDPLHGLQFPSGEPAPAQAPLLRSQCWEQPPAPPWSPHKLEGTSAPAPGVPYPPALTWVFSPLFSTIQLFPPLLKMFSQRHPQLSWQALLCPVGRAGTICVQHGQLWVSAPPNTILSEGNFSQIMGFKARSNPMEKANRLLNDLIKQIWAWHSSGCSQLDLNQAVPGRLCPKEATSQNPAEFKIK